MSAFCIDYDVNMPVRANKRSEEYLKVMDFLKLPHDTMRFVYESPEIARKRKQSLLVTIKRENIPVKLVVSNNELYVGKIKR